MMQHNTEIFDRNLYLYILWSFLNAATLFWRSMVFSLVNFIASYVLHNKLLKSVFHCPTSFFDTTPTGRIVNRFSKDIDMIDFSLPAATVQALDAFMLIFSSVVVISIMSPVVIAAAIPIGLSKLVFTEKGSLPQSPHNNRLVLSVTRHHLFLFARVLPPHIPRTAAN